MLQWGRGDVGLWSRGMGRGGVMVGVTGAGGDGVAGVRGGRARGDEGGVGVEDRSHWLSVLSCRLSLHLSVV